MQRLLEGVDIVDALADERPFAENVLIDVGNGARVGSMPGSPPLSAHKRSVCPGQADATRGCRIP